MSSQRRVSQLVRVLCALRCMPRVQAARPAWASIWLIAWLAFSRVGFVSCTGYDIACHTRGVKPRSVVQAARSFRAAWLKPRARPVQRPRARPGQAKRRPSSKRSVRCTGRAVADPGLLSQAFGLAGPGRLPEPDCRALPDCARQARCPEPVCWREGSASTQRAGASGGEG